MRRLLYFALLLAVSGCAFFKPSDHFEARETSFDALPDWREDNHAQALSAFMASCKILAAKAQPASGGSGLKIPEHVWQSLCNDALRIPPDNEALARQFFERRFVPYRVANNDEEQGLFTGYYEPVLYGSYKKKGYFIYPLYMAPAEISGKKPYYTQAEINEGALSGRKLELIWVDDPVMRFFLQIQGSGIVRLPHRKQILVGYASGNGQPYVSLGKVMGDQGIIDKDKINFFTLRQWLYDHPTEAFRMMEKNPSYVFFKKLETDGVIGAVGAVLTRERSLAVDSRYIPYGLPLFLETKLPATPARPEIAFNRIMIAQDTGGAIKGPVRGDIFFGTGEDSEYLAGFMHGRGSYSLLVPKEIAYQLQQQTSWLDAF